MSRAPLVCSLLLVACAGAKPAPTPPVAPAPRLYPEETAFLSDLRQLTFGGENAEAYWSFDGKQLSFQARGAGDGCDRIYRLPIDSPTPIPVSSGKGATTCAHFFPSGELLYSSTHLAGDACPPRPDMKQGYVWALYDSYDIFKVDAQGGNQRRLTSEKGYDAEATVCARDGSIVFTSTRDGDIDLYRMDADGKNVKRLTREPGYDGGAFFNRDCSKIVWRASRPRPGKELDDFRRLLGQGLVRPSKLEVWTADADGSNPTQLTYLDAASFAPFFHPTENVIVFSSNSGDAHGREFDIWAMHGDGSGLVKVTHAPGFDGFPHFSPDGQWLAFSSNRATAPGQHDTNVFLARWRGLPPPERTGHASSLRSGAWTEAAADRIARDIAWLADPARTGRGVGTPGLAEAGAFLEGRLKELGVEPAGDEGGYRHGFSVVTAVKPAPNSRLAVAGKPVAAAELTVLGFSGTGKVEGKMVLAGYGIVDEATKLDDYAGLDVKGKVVLVRRFAPEGAGVSGPARTRLGDIRRKAWSARERGAKALVVVDWPLPPSPAPADWKPPPEAPLLTPSPDGGADVGLPVLMVKRVALEPYLKQLEARRPVKVNLEAGLLVERSQTFNVVGRISAARGPRRGMLIVGAHYDHLGLGGHGSLAPEKHEPHLGADDNASGTATVLEVARELMSRRAELTRDVVVILFSGEEAGLLGSTQFTRARGELLADTVAMLNLDMVGRLRGNRVEVLGSETAAEWSALLTAACDEERIGCAPSSDGFGASDQAAFYGAGLPVLHFFTGTHSDYHKPSDTAAKINAAGAAAIARLVGRVVLALEGQPRLSYRKGVTAPARGDARSFNASLGTMPDYAGPPGGAPGVLLAGVRPGGAAEKAGMKRGDILIRLGKHEIRSVQDLGFALSAARPGETVTAVVIREGKETKLETTFQEAKGPR